MVAVTKLASVPASIARRPRRARSWRRLGASAPMPPIWMPIELKFANPHSANVAIVNDRGSSDVLQRPELRVGDELVEHHARAEQVADRRRIRHGTPIAQATGANTQPKICCRLRPARPSIGVDQRDQRQERDEHRADVQRQVQPLARAAPGRVDHVDVGPLDLQLHRPHRLGRLGLGHEHLGHHDRARAPS